MSTPRQEFNPNDPHYLGMCNQDCKICANEAAKSESVEPTPSPELEPNHHWKWFLKRGQTECPHAEQNWHKTDPHICRPCEYAKNTAQAYADMVSKQNLETVVQLTAELVKAQKEKAALRARISELELKLGEEKRRSQALLNLGAPAELRTK